MGGKVGVGSIVGEGSITGTVGVAERLPPCEQAESWTTIRTERRRNDFFIPRIIMEKIAYSRYPVRLYLDTGFFMNKNDISGLDMEDNDSRIQIA
jgi:hypothetical protein